MKSQDVFGFMAEILNRRPTLDDIVVENEVADLAKQMAVKMAKGLNDIRRGGRMFRKSARWIIIVGCLTLASLASASTKMFYAKGGVGLEDTYAISAGLSLYKTDRSVTAGVQAGKLVPVPIFSQWKLPASRRYLTPEAASFVYRLDAAFYNMTEDHLIVDSAVRSAQTQARVRRWNWVAAPAYGRIVSSHEFGTTFDLSKKCLHNRQWRKMHRGEYQWLLTQLMMYQAQGRIHVINERACLHVMVRSDELSEVRGTVEARELPNEILEREQPAEHPWRDFVVHALEEVRILPSESVLVRCDLLAGTCRLLREQDRGQVRSVDDSLQGDSGTLPDDSVPYSSDLRAVYLGR